jgi:hypothetical protein
MALTACRLIADEVVSNLIWSDPIVDSSRQLGAGKPAEVSVIDQLELEFGLLTQRTGFLTSENW